MNLRTTTLIITMALMGISQASLAHIRDDVNFAFGGATTNSFNATIAFATQVPGLEEQIDKIREDKLDLIGITQQLDFAAATLNDVLGDYDLFWVYAGVNNYLVGEQDASRSPGEIGVALERLYTEVGARRFVVPNLPSIGDLPLYAVQPQEVRDEANDRTIEHNENLLDVIASFREAHPDVVVVEVDVFSIFKNHRRSNEFAEVNFSCDMFVPPEQLAIPGACDGFLYLDFVHPVSNSWTPVAETVASALAGSEIDRIITIGDSFSDLGSMNDTFERALDVSFPGPPFTGGRFTEGENVIEKVESLLDIPVSRRAFSQPIRLAGTYTEKTVKLTPGGVFIPKQLSGSASKVGAEVTLRFQTEHCPIVCHYRYNGEGVFGFTWCHWWWRIGGDRLDASRVVVKPKNHVESVTIDWLYYELAEDDSGVLAGE